MMAVTKRLRFEILRRDNHTCRYCGNAAPNVQLTVDHVTPVSLGGSDKPTNLVTACADCNSGKTSVPPGAPLVDDVSSDALRWARAMSEAVIGTSIDVENIREVTDDLAAKWDSLDEQHCRWVCPIGDGWRNTLSKFIELGLNTTLLEEAMEKALTNKTIRPSEKWRYFCGIAWKVLAELQETAREILASEEANYAS